MWEHIKCFGNFPHKYPVTSESWKRGRKQGMKERTDIGTECGKKVLSLLLNEKITS
jgi:hypothetical protein